MPFLPTLGAIGGGNTQMSEAAKENLVETLNACRQAIAWLERSQSLWTRRRDRNSLKLPRHLTQCRFNVPRNHSVIYKLRI